MLLRTASHAARMFSQSHPFVFVSSEKPDSQQLSVIETQRRKNRHDHAPQRFSVGDRSRECADVSRYAHALREMRNYAEQSVDNPMTLNPSLQKNISDVTIWSWSSRRARSPRRLPHLSRARFGALPRPDTSRDASQKAIPSAPRHRPGCAISQQRPQRGCDCPASCSKSESLTPKEVIPCASQP